MPNNKEVRSSKLGDPGGLPIGLGMTGVEDEGRQRAHGSRQGF